MPISENLPWDELRCRSSLTRPSENSENTPGRSAERDRESPRATSRRLPGHPTRALGGVAAIFQTVSTRFSILSPIPTARHHPRSAGLGIVAQVVLCFGSCIVALSDTALQRLRIAVHFYTGPLGIVLAGPLRFGGGCRFQPLSSRAMHDPGFELCRKPLPRT
jgi:hypothetical protein